VGVWQINARYIYLSKVTTFRKVYDLSEVILAQVRKIYVFQADIFNYLDMTIGIATDHGGIELKQQIQCGGSRPRYRLLWLWRWRQHCGEQNQECAGLSY